MEGRGQQRWAVGREERAGDGAGRGRGGRGNVWGEGRGPQR